MKAGDILYVIIGILLCVLIIPGFAYLTVAGAFCCVSGFVVFLIMGRVLIKLFGRIS